MEHQRSPLSLSSRGPDESQAGAELCIPGARAGEGWLEQKSWALGAQHPGVIIGRCQATGLLWAQTHAWGQPQPRSHMSAGVISSVGQRKLQGCKDGANPDGQKPNSKAKS